ncbi:unnamed protein product [Hymenolepis diminuta]|uniref:Uncharacterized protein n=1 Tax=Hymenolepis diminuta TaxID=6216 RepID=A0A564Z8M6_HYMDI|nr:unnamed protein product [Hymenolepis diminuta]
MNRLFCTITLRKLNYLNVKENSFIRNNRPFIYKSCILRITLKYYFSEERKFIEEHMLTTFKSEYTPPQKSQESELGMKF